MFCIHLVKGVAPMPGPTLLRTPDQQALTLLCVSFRIGKMRLARPPTLGDCRTRGPLCIPPDPRPDASLLVREHFKNDTVLCFWTQRPLHPETLGAYRLTDK